VKTERNRPVAVGKSLVAIANGWGLDPVDAYLRLLAEEDTAASFIGHAMSPENVERVLRHPLVMIGSHGSSMAPVGEAAKARPHPRSYGTFPRVLGFYARQRGLFGLPTGGASPAARRPTSWCSTRHGCATPRLSTIPTATRRGSSTSS
jgi:N-acyl-D-amino-acid deacylase